MTQNDKYAGFVASHPHWFPKPPDCTCAYDAGWIYMDKDCKVHKGMEPPK